jgi:hypothetical protein
MTQDELDRVDLGRDEAVAWVSYTFLANSCRAYRPGDEPLIHISSVSPAAGKSTATRASWCARSGKVTV